MEKNYEKEDKTKQKSPLGGGWRVEQVRDFSHNIPREHSEDQMEQGMP